MFQIPKLRVQHKETATWTSGTGRGEDYFEAKLEENGLLRKLPRCSGLLSKEHFYDYQLNHHDWNLKSNTDCGKVPFCAAPGGGRQPLSY